MGLLRSAAAHWLARSKRIPGCGEDPSNVGSAIAADTCCLPCPNTCPSSPSSHPSPLLALPTHCPPATYLLGKGMGAVVARVPPTLSCWRPLLRTLAAAPPAVPAAEGAPQEMHRHSTALRVPLPSSVGTFSTSPWLSLAPPHPGDLCEKTGAPRGGGWPGQGVESGGHIPNPNLPPVCAALAWAAVGASGVRLQFHQHRFKQPCWATCKAGTERQGDVCPLDSPCAAAASSLG